MKKALACLLLLLLAHGLAAAEYTASNANMSLKYKDGVVSVFVKGAEAPLAVIKPTIAPDAVPDLIKHPDSGFPIFSLRAGETSITFKMEWTRACFTMSLNRGASPVTVEWNPAAVIIPDVYAEDTVLAPQDAPRAIPPFVTMMSALVDNGNAIISCLPVRATAPAILSGDLKTLTIEQNHADDYIFVFSRRPGIWHTATLPAEQNKTVPVEGWTMPFPADWMVALPVEQDFITAGDGIYTSWHALTVVKDDKGKERVTSSLPRCSMTNLAARTTWTSGFEGSFHYPAEIVNGAMVLCNPRFRPGNRFNHSLTKPVYIYALTAIKGTPDDLAMPTGYLPPWTRDEKVHFTINYGRSPATCASTNKVETIFRQEKAREKVEDIRWNLKAMQFFVEAIRSRIEGARDWANEMKVFAARAVAADAALAPDAQALNDTLAEVEKQYAEALPRIQQPPAVSKMSEQLIACALSDLDNEEKEEQAKELGRKIRTIGGGQDNLCAQMRHIGKCLRFQALNAYAKATTPNARAFWTDVYSKTEWMLQGAYGHEGR